jgi:hypothetical protein
LGFVLSVLLNSLLGVAAYVVARDAFRMPTGLARVLAAAVLAWMWLTVGMQVLGTLGLYQVGPVFAWTGAGVLLAACIWYWRPAAGVALGSRNGSTDGAGAPARKDGSAWGVSAVIAVALAIWSASALLIYSLLMPVKVVSDGPIYHLYFAVRWWKEGRLFLIAAPFGETAAPYFPAGGDLWFTWLIIPWGGDRLARVGQVPFMLWSLCAVFALARRVGVSVTSAVVAAAWFAMVMPFHLFSFEANVDTIFVAGYLTAVYFFFRHALGDDNGPSLALGALAAGGAWGTKATATVFVPVILALAAVVVLARRQSARAKVGQLAMLLVLPFVMSGYWFARNAMLSGGNPLYPLHLKLFGHVLLPGWYESSAMQYSQFYIERSDWRCLVDIMNSVLDPRLVLVWLAALLGAWSIGWRRPYARWVWGFSALAALNVACYWILIPYRTQQRFMLQGIGLWAVPLACLFDRSPRVRALAVLLLAVHVLTPQTWPFERPGGGAYWDLSRKIPVAQYSTISIPRTSRQLATVLSDAGRAWQFAVLMAAGAASCFVAWLWARVARRSRPANWAAAVGATVIFVLLYSIGLLENELLKLRFPVFRDYFNGWNELETRVGKDGARIAYAGTNLPYYLMGAKLQNEVRYININRYRDWLLHDYHRQARARGMPTWGDPRPLWDRLEKDYDAWLENLRAEKIQILVVARAKPEDGPGLINDPQRFTVERQWAETHPESFTPLYGVRERDPEFRFYRVHPAGQKSPRVSTDLTTRGH